MNQVVLLNAFEPEAETDVEPNAEVASRSTPPNVACEITDNPVTTMLTLLPDTAVVGATIDGVPITVNAASAVSVGLVAVNLSVYSPGATVAGNSKVTLAKPVGNEPDALTVTGDPTSVIGVMSVDP